MPLDNLSLQMLFERWIKPSSDSENGRHQRTERMIKQAIDAHPAFNGLNPAVYAKGSYANNTNVRNDSDVDIVVENRDLCHYESVPGITLPTGHLPPYTGPWTTETWRTEVTRALRNGFPTGEIDASGEVAIVVSERRGSRTYADVVPSFGFRLYDGLDRWHEGSVVFKRTTSERIVNWPKQQYDNGVSKNRATDHRYKNFVRVLKNAENACVDRGEFEAKPSYLMECLVWNVPDGILTRHSDRVESFKETLRWLHQGLRPAGESARWMEPNGIKRLFTPAQKWTTADALEVVEGAWRIVAL